MSGLFYTSKEFIMSKKCPPLPPGYVGVTTHRLKTHLTEYMRRLNAGEMKALVILRYNKPQGLIYPLAKTKRDKNENHVD